MNKRLILICFLLGVPWMWSDLGMVYAQYADLVGKSYAERAMGLKKLHREVVDEKMDWNQALDTLSGMRGLAKQFKDPEFGLEADLIEAWYQYNYQSRSLEKLKEVYAEAEKLKFHTLEVRAIFLLALHYWYAKEYEQAFRWYLKLDERLENVDIKDLPDMGNMYMEIGNAYYHFGDYLPAITYFQRVTQLPIQQSDTFSWRHAWNTMGLSYRKVGDVDRSDSCFLIIINHAIKDSVHWKDVPSKDSLTGQWTSVSLSEQWNGIASGNLAQNYYERGDYNQSIPLFVYDIQVAEKYGIHGLIIGAATSLADMYLKLGKMPLAKTYMDQAYVHIRQLGQTDALHRLFPIMSKWYMTSGDRANAARYLDSSLVARERFDQKFSSLHLMRAQQEVSANQRTAAIMELQIEKARQVGRRNLYISGLFVLVLAGVFLGYRQRQRSQLRIQERDMKLLIADQELQLAREQLEAFARTVSDNNRKLEELAKSDVDANGLLIQQLSEQVILTDADWERFRALFNKVYPGFYQRLRATYPGLTPAEIRCLSMEKLNFSNKEMGAMQGISARSVMVTKHRIRKKLQLSGQEDLVRFVQSI